jgi:uncharacterized protein YwqG
MFASIDEARAALDEVFVSEIVEEFLRALLPATIFTPLRDDAPPKLGATRIGGTPDMPPNLAWPVRPAPPNVAEIAARGGSAHGEHIRKHLERALPFEFVAQIDLVEAARLGPATEALPREGRLLFFYEGSTAPWNGGAESCRVLWDRAPAEILETKPRPADLFELGVAQIAEYNDKARQHGWAPMTLDKTLYWGPARAMRLEARLQLPDPSSIEAQQNEALTASFEDEEIEDAYRDMLSDRAWVGSAHHSRQQLLGAPTPEQDDPRYDAVVVTDHGVQHLSRDAWEKAGPSIAQRARNWRLLFQLDMRDYLQMRYTEGTVYFLIRHDDLAARAFGEVVAIYQQT